MSDTPRIRAIKSLLQELHHDGVRDRNVLLTIAKVPRDRFVPSELQHLAWENRALPIGGEQTISQPLIVGLMTQALALEGSEKVLEIGSGSGYQTAILRELAGSVVSVERLESLARMATERLEALGYDNVRFVIGDGTQGWPEAAPYDRIIVTAAAPQIPASLLEQLAPADGARMVVPVGTVDDQDLIVIQRREGRLQQRNLGAVRFVPLIGKEGYPPETEES